MNDTVKTQCLLGTIVKITNKKANRPDRSWRRGFINRYGSLKLCPSGSIPGKAHMIFTPFDAPFTDYLTTTDGDFTLSETELVIETSNTIYEVLLSDSQDP